MFIMIIVNLLMLGVNAGKETELLELQMRQDLQQPATALVEQSDEQLLALFDRLTGYRRHCKEVLNKGFRHAVAMNGNRRRYRKAHALASMLNMEGGLSAPTAALSSSLAELETMQDQVEAMDEAIFNIAQARQPNRLIIYLNSNGKKGSLRRQIKRAQNVIMNK